MESTHLSKTEQKRALKDIGDTSLILCGYFAESVNPKILDIKYYMEIGQVAYSRLNSFVPSFYDVDEFYRDLSGQFNILTNLMRIVQKSNVNSIDQESLLLVSNKNIKAS